MSKLVIVESPTKAKTLTSILGRDYVIKASMGHIRDLPKSGLAIDVEHDFAPDYAVSDKAKKVLDDLKKSAKEKNTIVLATDPDREGEAIAWHLRELLTPKTKKEQAALTFERVVFHELTKEAVEEAFTHPGILNMDLVNAQQARRVLDRLVGYKLSPLLWKKVRYGLSAGRVQSVAVRLIVERERERQAFRTEEYWSIKANFTDNDSKRHFIANYVSTQETISSRDAENIVSELNNDSFKVTSVKKSERRKKAYPPLRTSTLQQASANVYGFTAKRTMDAAQKLFEKGYITYHRTDSLNLSPQFIESTRKYIVKTFGKDYVPDEAVLYKTKSANAQEAHEAIRPTDLTRVPNGPSDITEDEAKVYSIVWLRSVESQMTSAVYDQTTIEVTSTKAHLFRATGSVIKFDGWLAAGKKVSIEENDEEIVPMPSYDEGELVLIHEVLPEQHFTQPPAQLFRCNFN
jgi:DNA topoisomerase I